MSDWQLIETAPRDGANILLAGGKVVLEGWIFDDRIYGADGERIDNITHWMPLPPPPKPLTAHHIAAAIRALKDKNNDV